MNKINHLPLLTALFILLFAACKKDDESPAPVAECIHSDAQLNIIDELNGAAHLFNGADPSAEDDNLDKMIDYLGDAHFVGMGEATHGTAEFYKMKDKIFRLLVAKKGFKAIVFEIPWGNCLKVNDFVINGTGTAKEVINQTYYWTYDTQEVIDLAQWVHDYNIGLAENEKIYFVGCDVQGGDFEIEKNVVFDFIEKVQPDSLNAIESLYFNLPNTDIFDYVNVNNDRKELNINGTKKVYDLFVENKDEFIAATSELEYEIAFMAAHVIKHREYVYRTSNYGVTRDSLMAIYSEWWQRILADDAKVAIWAHNAHVMDAAAINQEWMGTFLRRRHSDDYKIVGFSFGKGSANAFVAGANFQFVSPVEIQVLTEFTCNTVNELLSQIEGEQHYIIFDELAGEPSLYFDKPQRFLQFGAGFSVPFKNNYVLERPLSRFYDVLVHFDEMSASVLR